jgi:hypothetical protein
MDKSNSMSSQDFQRQQLFVQNVVSGFTINPTHTQVAVVSFSNHATVDFYLNSYSSKASVNTAVSNIHFEGGISTNTASAIASAVSNVFSPAHGERANAVKVLILITDGR